MNELPTVEQYKIGLTKVAPNLNSKHREMLIEHYQAKRHCLTANELAAKVGYKNYSAVNLQYGTLGKNLSDAMNWTPPAPAQASFSIAWFLAPDEKHNEWRWEMHQSLATALEELGWVSKIERVPVTP
jgi:predicted HNH restriction endonuclease